MDVVRGQLRRLVEELGSQRKAGARLGVTQTAIQKILAGKNDARREVVELLERIYPAEFAEFRKNAPPAPMLVDRSRLPERQATDAAGVRRH